MTNNELIEIVDKEIDDIFGARIDFNKIHKDENGRTSDYDMAYYYQVREEEDVALRDFAKGQLHRFIQSLDLNTGESPYKEMWKELKSSFEDSKTGWEEAEKNNCIRGFYRSAGDCSVRKCQLDSILCAMKSMEKERGIE